MPRRSSARVAGDYHTSVFINCPFDEDYRPLFDAIVYTVFRHGLKPRCALEAADGSAVRMDKITQIIAECRWAVHDISRTELNRSGLPRFNMPLELGLFLGARRFGDRMQQRKNCLTLDRQPHRYQAFLSDIAGRTSPRTRLRLSWR